MFDRYDVGGFEVSIVGWGEASAEDQVGPAALASLYAHIEGDAVARLRLRRWLLDAGFDLSHGDELELLGDAVESGRALVVPAAALRPARRPAYEPTLEREAEPDEPPPDAEHDWIEVELTDEDDVPIQGAAFELTLPDGTVRKATTNERGRFFVPRTDSGQCQLRWMRLHTVDRAPQFASAAATDGA